MKLILSLVLMLSAITVNAREVQVEVQEQEHVFTPEQEAEFYQDYFSPIMDSKAARFTFKFPQTKWNECEEEITANYYGYNCARSRGISVILKKFIDTHFYTCVDKGLAAQGGGVVNELHIVHAGILGDPNHSPKSLHAENRAIDVKSLEMKLTNGQVKKFVYEGTPNRAFYTAFRKCWADIVHNYNGCPYQSTKMYTGSIGWENADHQHHMHTSVPYCVGGKYGAYYYQR